MHLQRQQWRQTKRQLLQTGMLDLPASAKAAGRRTRNGAAAADLTDTDSEAEDELDSDPPEGEDSSALTEAFRDTAPKGALLGVVLRKRPGSMRLLREALRSERSSALRRLHLHCWAGELLGKFVGAKSGEELCIQAAVPTGGRSGMVWAACRHHADSVACAWQRLLGSTTCSSSIRQGAGQLLMMVAPV